jgi:phosphate transport system substrate-binding protein
MKSRSLELLITVGLLAVLGGCSSVDREADTAFPGTVLRGAGATFPSLLYNRWFSTYEKDHAQISIRYDSVGSGEGVRRFKGRNVEGKDLVDFGASDAAMEDGDMAEVSNGVILLPVTAGSVVLAYNLPMVEGELRLSRRAYTGIFLGEVRGWDDPLIAEANPGITLPQLTITVAVRQDPSGTTYALTKHLDAVSDQWRRQFGPRTLVDWPGNAMRAKGNEGLAGRIQQSIGSIGYVGYEFAARLGLKMATLENRERNFVKPSQQSSVASLSAVQLPHNLRVFLPDPPGRDSYPIVTYSWVLLYRNYPTAEKAREIRNLFRWCLVEGQNYAPELHYVRLPVDVTDKALAALNTITPTE